MLKKFLALFERKPRLDHPTEKVFSIEGTNYYQFKDISKIKCFRAFIVSDFYSELSMKCSREYLVAHTDAVEKLLSNSKQINITQVAQLNLQLKERLEMIYEPDIIYKIASVVFFDKTENPYEYDDMYGKEKVERFKRHAQKNDGFFFETLFKGLLNTKDLKDQDLETYMNVAQKITQSHWDNIFTILSSTKETKDLAHA